MKGQEIEDKESKPALLSADWDKKECAEIACWYQEGSAYRTSSLMAQAFYTKAYEKGNKEIMAKFKISSENNYYSSNTQSLLKLHPLTQQDSLASFILCRRLKNDTSGGQSSSNVKKTYQPLSL